MAGWTRARSSNWAPPSEGESEKTRWELEILLPSGAQLSRNEVAALLAGHDEFTASYGDLEPQVEWFKKQLFGSKSERRIGAAGIPLARSTLPGWMQGVADRLEPIYQAQLAPILSSSVLAMGVTPITVGRGNKRGRMKTGYFWPIYGEAREVAFPFSPSRSASVVREVLGDFCGVLLSDGYTAYDSYANAVNALVYAQCWSHTRRRFVGGEGVEPKRSSSALAKIGRLCAEERKLKSIGVPRRSRSVPTDIPSESNVN